MKRFFMLSLLLVSLLLSACEATDVAVRPSSDSGLQFQSGARIPSDTNVYQVSGEVVDQIENLQTTNARGSGVVVNGYGSSSFSMWSEGKGFLRVKVYEVSPASDIVKPGMIVILKTTDTKLRAVLPGDRLVLKCRAQYEAVGAVLQSESFDSKKYETWEFDLCRSVSPQIGVSHE